MKNENIVIIIVIIITSKDLLGLVFAAPKVDIVTNDEWRTQKEKEIEKLGRGKEERKVWTESKNAAMHRVWMKMGHTSNIIILTCFYFLHRLFLTAPHIFWPAPL